MQADASLDDALRPLIKGADAVTQFFEQDQANVLPLDKTVMQTMEHAASDTDWLYEQLRAPKLLVVLHVPRYHALLSYNPGLMHP